MTGVCEDGESPDHCFQVAASVHDAKDERLAGFNAVHDHVFAYPWLRSPGPRSFSRERPMLGNWANVRKRSVIASIGLLGISMLLVSLAT